MLPDAELFLNGVNLITGSGRACGKTTFARAAALSLRNGGYKFAAISVGAEGVTGARADLEGSGRRTGALRECDLSRDRLMPVGEGEVFVSASRFLGAATCLPEVLEALPGESALGKLVIARASRDGEVAFVGPERNEYLRWAIERIVGEDWASTIIVDGALNRMTQIASLPSARLFFAVRVDKSSILSTAEKMRRVRRLVSLPPLGELESSSTPAASICRIRGPLTKSVLEGIDDDARIVAVDDFSKIFLDDWELAALMKKRRLAVKTAADFGGFSVVLRGVDVEKFAKALGEELSNLVISWNAYSDSSSPRGIGRVFTPEGSFA